MIIKLIQKLIDKIRKKKKYSAISNAKYINNFQESNKLIIADDFDVTKLNIKIDGQNNIVKINNGIKIGLKLTIQGYIDNSEIIIGDNFECNDVCFQLGQNSKNFGKIKNVKIEIGTNTSWETGMLVSYNSNTNIKIGNNCMFAGNVTLYCTDAHPIFDKDSGRVLNKVDDINIGNHVWLGMNSTVLKNSTIPDGSIVGWGSVFSGRKTKSNCIYAGNPVKCIKENIDWSANGNEYGYIENLF